MGTRTKKTSSDEVLEALKLLQAALEESAEVARQIAARIGHITDRRAEGLSYADIGKAEPRPLIVEILTANLDRLSTAGNRIRRLEAQALYDDGLTMDEIAALFGVTRQRIGTLLRQRDE